MAGGYKSPAFWLGITAPTGTIGGKKSLFAPWMGGAAATTAVTTGGGGGYNYYYQQQKRKRLRIEQVNNELMLIVTAIAKTIH